MTRDRSRGEGRPTAGRDRGGTTGWILALDTGTSRVVLAAGAADGRPIAADSWPAGHRHGEQLLPGLERLMTAAGLERAGVAGIIAGTGPGAFTGLRVGIATAKTLAHAMGVPIVGISTGEALLRAAGVAAVRTAARVGARGDIPGPTGKDLVLLLPAGPNDRVQVRSGAGARILPAGTDPILDQGQTLVAVDLAGRAPAEASERGAAALDGLGAALLELGAARLASGDVDDPERLVPEYVTLPRGVGADGGEISWSRDLR